MSLRLLILSLGFASAVHAQTLDPLIYIPAGNTDLVERTDNGTVVFQDGAALRIGRFEPDDGRVTFAEASRVTLGAAPRWAYTAGERFYAVLDDDALIVLDLTDPTNPVLQDRFADVPFTYIQVSDGLLYGTQPGARVGIYDVSVPGELRNLHVIDAVGASIQFVVQGTFLYTVSDPAGLASRLSVYDVSTPFAPTEQDRRDSETGAPHALLLHDSRLYIAGHFDYSSGYLASFDVSDPYSLAPTDTLFLESGLSAAVPGPVGRVIVGGTGDEGLFVVDVQNPAQMEVLHSFPIRSAPKDLAWHPELNAVSATDTNRGLHVTSVSSTPRDLGTIWNGGHSVYAVAEGDRLYTWDDPFYTNESSGLRVFDIANPLLPIVLGGADVPRKPTGGIVRDGIAYITHDAYGGEPSLTIWNVSDPAALAPLGTALPSLRPSSISLYEETVYITSRDGLAVIDVSDLLAPVLSGTYVPAGGVLFANGGTIDPVSGIYYIVDGYGRVVALDVSSPDAVSEIAILDGVASVGPLAIDAAERSLYAVEYNHLHAVDITDPTAPVLRYSVQHGRFSDGVVLGPRGSDGRPALYLLDSREGAAEYSPDGDLVGQLAPPRSDYYNMGGGPDGVTLAGPRNGVYVFEPGSTVNAESASRRSPFVLSAVPNPTHDRARLTFVLTAPGDVEVTAYDALGRRVAGPTPRRLAAGSHEVVLDTRDWAPGVYVARVRAGEAVATTRLTVLR